jgi:hypothetical protein
MCVLIFSATFVWNIYYSKKNYGNVLSQICIDLHVRCLYFWHILMELEFFQKIDKNPQILNFLKICPVGDELLHADR